MHQGLNLGGGNDSLGDGHAQKCRHRKPTETLVEALAWPAAADRGGGARVLARDVRQLFVGR